MLEGEWIGTEFVQPIVVLNAGTHDELVGAAALASVKAWLATPENEAWEPWISTRFVKSVRRCKPGPFSRLETEALAVEVLGEARALGFAPVEANQLPPAIQRMQVSGLERPRREVGGLSLFGPGADCSGVPELVVNPGLEMSTGKTAAQVAHGLFALVKGQDQQWRSEWAQNGFPLRLWTAALGAWNFGLERGALRIEDAGFTEIEAGSCTVLAMIQRGE